MPISKSSLANKLQVTLKLSIKHIKRYHKTFKCFTAHKIYLIMHLLIELQKKRKRRNLLFLILYLLSVSLVHC